VEKKFFVAGWLAGWLAVEKKDRQLSASATKLTVNYLQTRKSEISPSHDLSTLFTVPVKRNPTNPSPTTNT
jgi:hypothetical protein